MTRAILQAASQLLRRPSAGLLLAISAAIAGFPLWWMYRELMSWVPRVPFNHPVVSVEAPRVHIQTEEVAANSRPLNGDAVDVTLLLQDIVPAQQIARGTLQVVVPDSLKRRLRYVPAATVRDDSSFTVEFSPMYGPLREATQVRVPLHGPSRHDRNADSGPFTFSLELPVIGQPRAYPDDWYHLAYHVSCPLPSDRYLDLGNRHVGFVLPVRPSVALGAGMQGKRLLLEQWGQNMEMPELSFRVERDPTDRAYIWAMSALPTLLGLLFAHALLFGPRRQHMSFDQALLGAAAMMLAVLPLRAVLISADIPGLSRVDLCLGLGIALIVSSLVARYGMEQLAPSVWAGPNATQIRGERPGQATPDDDPGDGSCAPGPAEPVAHAGSRRDGASEGAHQSVERHTQD
ncbi:MAG: hypothetical protein ACE149_11600 [Armatimonadota bacterium]